MTDTATVYNEDGDDRSASADLTPWGPLDRMWRLTTAIDGAIVRLGGKV